MNGSVVFPCHCFAPACTSRLVLEPSEIHGYVRVSIGDEVVELSLVDQVQLIGALEAIVGARRVEVEREKGRQ